MTERDADASAFPNTEETKFWPNCGLTKLQWASIQVAASIAPGLIECGCSEQQIAEKATLIAEKTLEWSAP